MASLLIVEDDPVLRGLYVKKFTLSGYEIRTAENGQKGLTAIQEKAPDVLILDIHMPVMDGVQVLGEIPKDKRSFPVIILTNFGDDETRKKAMDLGADDYFIKKDMTMKTLVEMVEKLLTSKGIVIPASPTPTSTPSSTPVAPTSSQTPTPVVPPIA